MHRFIPVFFVALICLPEFVYAQDALRGKIIDKETEETLPGAYVFLKENDGETITGSVTDENGGFRINRPQRESFILEVTFLGYETFRRKITKSTASNLGTIGLVMESADLETFEIQGSVLSGEVKGDTVSFNANAFKTRPEAEAGSLVRKMPGVVMNGNTIEVQGETVGRVLVDGEPFFGDDPAMAMQNIPVAIIDRIEFLDQKSDQAILTGFDDGETIKTINIITKKEVKGGQFGKMYAGYGTDNNYLLGGNLNFFNGSRRFTLLGLSNNINQQNFSADDLGDLASQGDRRRGGGGRNNSNALTTWERPGMTTTNSLGANFSDKFDGGKAKFTGSYFFNNSENFLNRYSTREYVLPSDSLQFYEEERNDKNNYQRHRLDMRLDYDISDRHALIWRPNISYFHRDSERSLVGRNLFDANTPISETHNTTRSTYESLRFNNHLTYRYKFGKEGRTLSTSISTQLNKSDNDENLISVNNSFQTGTRDSLIQNSTNKSNAFEYEFEIEYTEPLGENSQLRLEYERGNDLSDNRQEVFQRETESPLFRLDSALSNSFENSYLQEEFSLGYRYNNDKMRIFSSFDYQQSRLNSDRLFPGYENTKRNFGNFVPMLILDYDFNEHTNLRFFYRSDTDAPSVRQLQQVIDNDNPLQISTGNPDLTQEYEHRMYTRFRKMDPETSRSFFMYLSGSIRNNYLGNSTFLASRDTLILGDVLLRQGGEFSRPVNLDNYWNAFSYFSFGFPLPFMKSNLNLHTRASISNRPGLINNEINNNKNIGLGQGIGISSNVGEHLDFNISTRANYNIVRSSLQESLNNNYYTQNTTLDFYWNFASNFFIGSSVNNSLYQGLGEEFDQSVWLMNMDVGYRFLPGRKGELKLTVFDLLNQNTDIQTNVTDVYIENERTQTLQQFFMLTFTYNLRAFGNVNEGS